MQQRCSRDAVRLVIPIVLERFCSAAAALLLPEEVRYDACTDYL
jgi:hypothetical protein